MKLTGINKVYKRKNGIKVNALADINIELPEKGLIFITGKSGSGKTTLLNIIGGLDRADSGKIEIDGVDISGLKIKELNEYRGNYCGIVFQEYNLVPELNVRENVAISVEVLGRKVSAEKTEEILERVGLGGLGEQKISELSGGQRQRVAIARGIIKNPRLILADEPTGALDNETGEQIIEIFKEISKESLVIIVSHNKEYAGRYGDREIELSEGRIVKDSGAGYREEAERKEYKIEKTKMPIRTAIKIGCSNFKYHPIRLAMIILLSVITFSALGCSLSGIFINRVDVFISALEKNKIKYTAVLKYEVDNSNDHEYLDWSLDSLLGSEDFTLYKETALNKQEVNEIKKNTKGMVVGIIKSDIFHFQHSFNKNINDLNRYIQSTDLHYTVAANGFFAIDFDLCNRLGYDVYGDLPTNRDEIAINECIFNSFKILGYKNQSGRFEINNYNDLIGKTIEVDFGNYKTITGIVNTHCGRQCVSEDESGHLTYGTGMKMTEGYHEKIFVNPEVEWDYSCVLVELDSDKAELTAFVKYIIGFNENNSVYRFSNEISEDFYREFYNVLPFINYLCLWLSLILMFIVILMIFNFVTASIRSQLRQIGILSSLGVDNRGLALIYTLAMLLVGNVILLFSILIAFIARITVNKSYASVLKVDIMNFHIAVPFILCVILIAVITAGCAFSILKSRKELPAEKIRKGLVR